MNHYEILGVGPDATEQQIKEAYRREAMKWHPDRHDSAAAKGEADRRFKDLAVAYRTLRNPVDRANHDRQLEQKLRQEYDTRKKEQAQQDLSDNGPKFEEQTASSDDANQMFYEQMLDLAFELAGRGFPEFNIFKALIALGCPDSLAKAVATTAAKQGRGQQDKATSKAQDTGFASSELNAEFVVKPKRYLALLGAIFGLWMIYVCIRAWSPLNSVWHLLIQFSGGLFGAWCLIHWGQVSIANTLMIIDHQGIRFSRNGGRITKWAEIQKYSFDGKKLKISGIKTGKKWEEQIPKMFVSGDCQEIVSRIARFKNGPDGEVLRPTFPVGHRRSLTSVFLTSMIIVAFVGIFAAVALPAYQDYTHRAQVATGFSLGSEAAKKVGDYYATQKKGPGDLGATGFSLTPSKTVKDVGYNSQTGVLTISFQDGFFNAKSLLLVPSVADGKVTWLCTSTGIATQQLPQTCRATQGDANIRLAAIDAEALSNDKTQSDYAQALAAIEAQHPELNPDSPRYNAGALDWVVARKNRYDQGGGRSATSSLQQAFTDYAAALQQNQASQPNEQAASTPPLDAYISYIKNLSRRDRNAKAMADMGVTFPMLSGYLSYVKGAFRAEHSVQANLVENTQTWGFNSNHGSQGGFLVFQNRTSQQLKGITVEIQTEERSCEHKGSVYYMTLEFDRSVAPASVVGINFQFPTAIPNANRCMDVVDLIYG